MNPYLFVKKVNKFIYYIINTIYSLLFHLNLLGLRRKRTLKKNKELIVGNLEKGCLICGNGPSLLDFEFSKAKKLKIFTVNYFFKSNLTNIEPDFHILIDNNFGKIMNSDEGLNYTIKSYQNNNKTRFILRYDFINIIKKIDSKLERAFFVDGKLIQFDNYLKLNMTRPMTAAHNVVIMAIQTAIYMGFKKIYLIGCENNFFGNYKHFYDDQSLSHYKPSSWDGLEYVDLAFKHYDALNAYCINNRIEIINLTPKSYINSFKFMFLNDFYNNQ
jgi:hypothetical protein